MARNGTEDHLIPGPKSANRVSARAAPPKRAAARTVYRTVYQYVAIWSIAAARAFTFCSLTVCLVFMAARITA